MDLIKGWRLRLSHVWYLKGIPSYVAIPAGHAAAGSVEQIVYFQLHVVLDKGDHKDLTYKAKLLTEMNGLEIEDQIYAEGFLRLRRSRWSGIGAEALKSLA